MVGGGGVEPLVEQDARAATYTPNRYVRQEMGRIARPPAGISRSGWHDCHTRIRMILSADLSRFDIPTRQALCASVAQSHAGSGFGLSYSNKPSSGALCGVVPRTKNTVPWIPPPMRRLAASWCIADQESTSLVVGGRRRRAEAIQHILILHTLEMSVDVGVSTPDDPQQPQRPPCRGSQVTTRNNHTDLRHVCFRRRCEHFALTKAVVADVARLLSDLFTTPSENKAAEGR